VGEVPGGRDSFGVEDQLAVSAAGGDHNRRSARAPRPREEGRQGRIVDVLHPPILRLLALSAPRLRAWRAVRPERNDEGVDWMKERRGEPGETRPWSSYRH